jgi:hypothetical protein
VDGSSCASPSTVRKTQDAGGCSGRGFRLGQAIGEEALFRFGPREVERPAVGVVGFFVAAGATQQFRAGGVEVPVVVEVEAVEDGQTGQGPLISATAMARFSSTTGERVCSASIWYRAAISRQSRGSCRCRSAMAAWTT